MKDLWHEFLNFLRDEITGMRNAWHNYVIFLHLAFCKMSKEGQQQFVVRISQMIAISGSAAIVSSLYPLMDKPGRIIALPATVLAAWVAGRFVLGPRMIEVILDRE